jgi:hypothetical protein
MTSPKCSSAVPLTLVPALAAAVGCGPSTPALQSGVDPCLPASYQQAACQYAVSHQGYYYGGAWYPHAYAASALFYHNGYSRYVASGGRVQMAPASSYAPSVNGARPRTTVVRGGFGGIGSSRGFAGS